MNYKVKGKEFYINEFGCYEIMKAQSRPTVRVGNKVMGAARFIYEECFGEIPEGLLVRHKCDNQYCINPDHLELGTHQDNMNDLTKKRQCKGRPSRHLLMDNETELAKLLIRTKGMSLKEIADALGVPSSSVYIALNKRLE